MKTRMSLIVMVVTILIYPAMAIPYSATFTDLNQQLIASGPGTERLNIPFDVLNSTGQTWTDFHMKLPTGPYYPPYFIPANSVSNGETYTGLGTYLLSVPSVYSSDGNTVIDIIGLNILSTATYSFTLDIGSGEGGWALNGYPTVAGAGPPPTAAPEPATMLLVGLGLIGLAGVRRKFQK